MIKGVKGNSPPPKSKSASKPSSPSDISEIILSLSTLTATITILVTDRKNDRLLIKANMKSINDFHSHVSSTTSEISEGEEGFDADFDFGGGEFPLTPLIIIILLLQLLLCYYYFFLLVFCDVRGSRKLMSDCVFVDLAITGPRFCKEKVRELQGGWCNDLMKICSVIVLITLSTRCNVLSL